MDGSWTLESFEGVGALERAEQTCAEPTGAEPTWTAERIELLKLLWDEGITTAEIGRRIGVTKNAVVGKVHRIGLVPRIVKEAPPPRRNVFEFTGPACMWPIGHPTDNDFHFCGERPVTGKPYCEHHAAKAYIRVKEQRAEAA